MPRERSLFERLRDPTAEARRTIKEDTGSLVRSVIAHLSNMFNTKHGHSLTQPEYGIPDLSDLVHAFPDSIAQMQRAIRQTIETFEPRLTRINVRHIPSDDDVLTLRFEITAQLATASEPRPIRFVTKVTSTGQVDVGS